MEKGDQPGMGSGQRNLFRVVVAGVGLALFFSLASTPAWAGNDGQAGKPAAGAESKDLPILQKWSGDYPVAQIERLPADQQKERVGYIGDPTTWASVWEAFKPGEKGPELDFAKNLVVFSRNVEYYNRTSIAKVTMREGFVEVIAIETLTSTPLEDKVAMAMAVIPREGVKFILSGDKRIPVQASAGTGKEAVIDFDKISFIAGWTRSGKVQFTEGEYREVIAPGSATQIVVKLTDKRAFGILNGLRAAAAVLVTDPGGSGTFYDLALLYKKPDGWVNVDTFLLGDRVRVHAVDIKANEIVVNMTVHGPGENMCCPTLQVIKRFAVKDDRLVAVGEKITGFLDSSPSPQPSPVKGEEGFLSFYDSIKDRIRKTDSGFIQGCCQNFYEKKENP